MNAVDTALYLSLIFVGMMLVDALWLIAILKKKPARYLIARAAPQMGMLGVLVAGSIDLSTIWLNPASNPPRFNLAVLLPAMAISLVAGVFTMPRKLTEATVVLSAEEITRQAANPEG